MPKRSYDEAVAVTSGVQTGKERFGKSPHGGLDFENAPRIAAWRCNLTGLSQTQNLYFVAYLDKIYVYVPHFSTQRLPEHPALIFTSKQAVPGTRGCLDHRHPHAVNNLVVQFLGTEEVVATVRDDGDVDAFLVRHIAHAIERRAIPDSTINVDGDEVKPIFQSNVGMSAWGLAIHTRARIIATSANTHNITIFKLSLVEQSDDEIQKAEGSSSTRNRDVDIEYRVVNGQSNIPCIAFCNTGDDPEARWLLTTDISGKCRTIDLHTMQASQAFRFDCSPARLVYDSYDPHDPEHAGWTIMFLDRRSFLPERNFQDALGLGKGEVLPPGKVSASLWDISSTVRHIPDQCNKFSVRKRIRRPSSDPASPSIRSSDSEVMSPSRTDLSSDDDEETATVLHDEVDEDVMMVIESNGDDDSDSAESTYSLSTAPNHEASESSDTTYRRRGTKGRKPLTYEHENDLCGDNPCPILYSSVRSVYLLQPSNLREQGSPITSPTVSFTDALHQSVQTRFSRLNFFERLNMSAYIPAIGVVVLASQKGRALILSLTKISCSTPCPVESQDRHNTRPRSKYAMRIDRIVPTAEQERKLERPFTPLLGMATGPIQGTEHLADERKRWRLIMTYADHTVLSYELIRKRSRDSAVDIQDIVI